MTTPQAAHSRRIFRYGDKSFADPGTEYSAAQVLQHLRTYFPELGHARTEEKTLPDGTLEITFSKQVTRKGAVSSPSPIAALVAALTAVPPSESPLAPLYAALGREPQLTLCAIRQQTQLLHACAGAAQAEADVLETVISTCATLSPTPLPCLPLGF